MFNQLENVEATILLRDVERQHLDRVLAEQRPTPDLRQLQRVGLQVHVGHSGPLIGL